MRKILLTILLLFYAISFSQEITTVKGTILNANNNMPLENVNIVNLNKVIATADNVLSHPGITMRPLQLSISDLAIETGNESLNRIGHIF